MVTFPSRLGKLAFDNQCRLGANGKGVDLCRSELAQEAIAISPFEVYRPGTAGRHANLPGDGVEDPVAISAHLERAEHINGNGLRRMRLVRLNPVFTVTMPRE